ncbi:MAG TPA: [LysW]-aminoadipate kinase [Candidatus Limnocylindrales bacterium]|nr:[LysW]-aminoadipate kinase [Candidatus Limnocylindrales bacterium]
MLVLKLGGSLQQLDPLLRDIASRSDPMVIIHGANRELTELSTRLDHPPRMVTSPRGEVSRYTDAETMDHFLMAYAGKVNKRIVERLRALQRNAVGLTAMDGGIAIGRRKPDLRIREGDKVKVLHDDHSGTIEQVDPTLLRLLLDHGYLPVLTPPAISRDGVAINVDGDRLAMEVAAALHAERLLIFADTPGFLRDPADEATVIASIPVDRVDEYAGFGKGRARVKLLAAAEAVRRGITAVGLNDGRGERPLTDALAGSGTWIRA